MTSLSYNIDETLASEWFNKGYYKASTTYATFLNDIKKVRPKLVKYTNDVLTKDICQLQLNWGYAI